MTGQAQNKAAKANRAARAELSKVWGLGSDLTNEQIVEVLAARRAAKYPELYRGHKEDAAAFIRSQYTTRFDLLLAIA